MRKNSYQLVVCFLQKIRIICPVVHVIHNLNNLPFVVCSRLPECDHRRNLLQGLGINNTIYMQA